MSPLQIMNADNMTYQAAATSDARVTGILDKNDTSVNSTSGRMMNLEFMIKRVFCIPRGSAFILRGRKADIM